MKKSYWIVVLISLCSLFAAQAGDSATKKAKTDTVYGSDLPFLKGSMIAIKSYDPETQTYETYSPPFPGEGYSYVTPEGLDRGLEALDLQTIRNNPRNIVGNVYKVDNDLPTLFEHEKEARKNPEARQKR